MDELDGKLAIIRNDLAMGRFDEKELDILEKLLNIFEGYVAIYRSSKTEKENE